MEEVTYADLIEALEAARSVVDTDEDELGWMTRREIEEATGWPKCRVLETLRGLAVDGRVNARRVRRVSPLTGEATSPVGYRLAEG